MVIFAVRLVIVYFFVLYRYFSGIIWGWLFCWSDSGRSFCSVFNGLEILPILGEDIQRGLDKRRNDTGSGSFVGDF